VLAPGASQLTPTAPSGGKGLQSSIAYGLDRPLRNLVTPICIEKGQIISAYTIKFEKINPTNRVRKQMAI
jgi:hypothetical protein